MRKPRLPRAIAAPWARPGLGWRMAEWGSSALQALRDQIEEERAHRTGFLWLPVAFGLGVLLYFSAAREPALWAALLWLAGAILGAVILRGPARLFPIALAFMACGMTAGIVRTATSESPMLDRNRIAKVSGFIETVDETTRRHRITLRVTAIEGVLPGGLPHRLRIGAPGRATLLAGGHVTVQARVGPPSEPAMPGGYDFRRDAFFKGIGGVGYSLGKTEASPAPHAPDWSLRFNATIDNARNALTNRIAQRIGGDAGALAAALVTGKRGLISNDANDDLRASGLYHIVSISGLHMVLAAGVMFWGLRALLALSPRLALHWPIKKFAALGAMAGSIAYCIFSGSEVATERSLIMTLVMLGAILVDRPALAMRNVAISALIVLAREPEALLGPSFQMSFAAVAALIAGNEIWRRYRPEPEPEEQGRRFRQPDLVARIGRTVLLALGGIIATTILASLATAPFSAFHFHRLNPYGLIGNTLAIPLVSLVVMPAAVIGTLLLPLGLDGLVWSLMGEGIRGVLHVANAVASIEGAAPAIPRAPPMLFGLLVVALLTLLLFRSHLRLLSLPLLLVWAVLLRALPPPDLMIAPDGRMALIRTDQPGAFRLLSPATPSGFTLAQWLPALGDQRGPRDPSLRTGIRCDRNGCTGRLADGRPVAVALTLEAIRQDCTRAHLIVTPLSIPAGLCPSATLVIGRDQLARYGAIRLTLANDGTIRTLESSLHPESPRPWRKSLQEPTAMAANPPTSREAIPQPSVAERSDDDPALEPAPAQPLSTVE